MFQSMILIVLAYAITVRLSVAAPQASLPSLQNRDYTIHDCQTFTDQVALALDLGKEPLGAAIKEAQKGIASYYGFYAMFKDDKAIKPVTKMLQDILSLRPARGMRPNPFKAQSPEYFCVTPGTQSRYNLPKNVDPWSYCEGSTTWSFYMRGRPYIFLCPRFFHSPISPIGPPAKNCPLVEDNFFEPEAGKNLANYQKYGLIHELTHFYLGESSLNSGTKPKEVYDINRCVNMDQKNSLNNPSNLQNFIAMVEQKCMDEPDPWLPPFPFPSDTLAAADNSSESLIAFE